MKEQVIRQFRSLWSDEKRRGGLLLGLGLAGLLLIALSEWLPKSDAGIAAQSPSAEQDYISTLELRLEDLIGSVEGAGRTRVMITAENGEESVYAKDMEQSADGSWQEQHVLLGSGGAQGLIETVYVPTVLGVAVVCEGGADAAVQLRVTQIVQALTGVGSNHITVTKMA